MLTRDSFPHQVAGVDCSSAAVGIDFREDWYGASMPPLPQFGSFGMGTSNNLADDDDVDFLIVPSGECQQ